MLAPATQAKRGVSLGSWDLYGVELHLPVPLTIHIIHPRVSLSIVACIIGETPRRVSKTAASTACPFVFVCERGGGFWRKSQRISIWMIDVSLPVRLFLQSKEIFYIERRTANMLSGRL